MAFLNSSLDGSLLFVEVAWIAALEQATVIRMASKNKYRIKLILSIDGKKMAGQNSFAQPLRGGDTYAT